MFSLFKKTSNEVALATQTGEVFPIEEMSDAIFAEKAMGDGVFIKPLKKEVYAPISGKLKVVSATKHAYGIVDDEGLEILVHVGIDSVNLEGKGFKCYVREGQNVKAGQLLCEIDFDTFAENNISTETAIIILNKKYNKSDVKYGEAEGGLTAVFNIWK